MNNIDINLIKDFRRFANTYIYPDIAPILFCSIKDACDANDILYSRTPQATIKFHSDINTQSDRTLLMYNILRNIFVDFYNKPNVVNFIRNKIHTEIQDEELKVSLRNTLQKIQCGNLQYLGLLFNITCLTDNYVYLYL